MQIDKSIAPFYWTQLLFKNYLQIQISKKLKISVVSDKKMLPQQQEYFNYI